MCVYDCLREHGKIHGQTLTNQSQNNCITKKKSEIKARRRSKPSY